MKEPRISRHMHELAELGVPTDLDLWPAIRAQVTATRPAGQGQSLMLSRLKARRGLPWAGARQLVAACCTVVLVLMLGLLATAPAVRAAVLTQMQQRFGIVLIEPTAVPPPSGARPATSTAQPIRWMSPTEAQQQVPWPIRLPMWLPPGLTLRGVDVFGMDSPSGPKGTLVSYGPSSEMLGGLGIQQRAGSGEGGPAFPASKAQEVRVNGQPAIYVRGVWERTDGWNLQWNDAADSAILSWEADGFTYYIQFGGLGLTREDLIRIAESLR